MVQANSGTNDHTSEIVYSSASYPVYISFAAPSAANQFKKIKSVKVYVYSRAYSSGVLAKLMSYLLKSGFDEETAVYSQVYNIDLGIYIASDTAAPVGSYAWLCCDYYEGANIANWYDRLLKYGVSIKGANVYIYTAHSSNKPYLVVTFSDDSVHATVESASPSSGYIPKYAANTFAWTTGVSDGLSYATPMQASAELQWKESESGTVHTVSCGTEQSVTIPANTFTSDTVIWRVVVTDTGGTQTASDWYTLSTVEATSSANTVSPKNTMIDGSADQLFEWEHIISTGTSQTAAQLQKSTDGSTWTTLASVSGSALSTTIPGGTFSSGTWYWRVRTANTDGTYGSWSDAATFISVAAPPKPSVNVTQTARPTVSWQATDQQGYQVQIGDVYDSGTLYGTATSLKLPVYLEDGQYTVKVRIQNIYGLWSEWGTAALAVQMEPDEDITLEGYADNAAYLTWETETAYDAYVVYRNGKAIAKTAQKYYQDLYAAGTCTYYIRGIYDDSDDYGLSAELQLGITPETLVIIDVERNEVIPLPYSEVSMRTTLYANAREITTRHLSGGEYPSAEISEYSTKTVSFRAAFFVKAEADQLEKLLGKVVCVKTKDGDSVIGILARMNKTVAVYYTGFSCTVSQMEWLEDVEL